MEALLLELEKVYAAINALSDRSQLHNFESLCGVALAVNLAYLNLARFRYRRLIANAAQKVVIAYEGNGADSAIVNTPWFKDLLHLAACADDEFESSCQPSDTLKRNLRSMPMFQKSWDFIISVVACIFAAAVLAFGIAQQVGLIEWGQVFFADGAGLTVVFFLLCVSILAPMFFIGVGMRLVILTHDYIKTHNINIADQSPKSGNIQDQIQKLKDMKAKG